VILCEARTQSTYTSIQYHTISPSRSYYNLGSHFSYRKESLKPKGASKDRTEFVEAISLII
jgi:hypothetical protein